MLSEQSSKQIISSALGNVGSGGKSLPFITAAPR